MWAAEEPMMRRVREQEMGSPLPSPLLTGHCHTAARRSRCPGGIGEWLGSTSGTVRRSGQLEADHTDPSRAASGKCCPERGREPESKAVPSKNPCLPFQVPLTGGVHVP